MFGELPLRQGRTSMVRGAWVLPLSWDSSEARLLVMGPPAGHPFGTTLSPIFPLPAPFCTPHLLGAPWYILFVPNPLSGSAWRPHPKAQAEGSYGEEPSYPFESPCT